MNRHEEKRFWKKVIKGPTRNACWLWVGAIGDDGYGRFWTQAETGKQCMLRAHRAAAEIIYGHNAIAEKLVTHLCDNPLCVRAENGREGHLFIGTHAENMAEREARSRGNLHSPLWKHQGRATRAASARLLRDLTLTYGYDQHQVDELMRGIIMTGQIPLF
ncbi:hypothetical protein [Rothia dentocariosa]